jgi:uncharacterized cupin superfamily protein
MEHVSLEDVENSPHPMGVNTHRKQLSDALGTEDVAVVHCELEPGDAFSGGVHTHHDQEELFLILEGEATFDVGPEGDEQLTIGAGEAVRFAPGEFQHGRNATDERVVGVIVAAPGRRHSWEDIESFAPCPECGEETAHGVRPPEGGMTVFCRECGHEMQVA